MATLDLSIIILNYNTKDLLWKCIKSLQANTKGISYEIIVVDNASKDGSQDLIKKIKSKKIKKIFNKKNFGFSAGNNIGINFSHGRYVLLLNSDTVFFEDTLETMINWMDQNPETGIATCKILNEDKSLQPTGGNFPDVFHLFLWAFFLDDLPFVNVFFGSYHSKISKRYNASHEQDWITGAFFLVRREVINSIGKLDEKFFMYVEDVDYCYRAKKAGWKVSYVPKVSIVHLGSGSGSGNIVSFKDNIHGKESSILGELSGLKIFYKKHYPHYLSLVLFMLLTVASLLRIVIIGILGWQPTAVKIYAKTFKII